MSEKNPQTEFTVLVIDDDQDVLAANARYLRLNNINTMISNSALAALDRINSKSVDVIVTDLKMPECDGLEFARLVRLSRPLTPIIFFSGFANVPDVVRAIRLGAVDFLEKPVEPKFLLEILLEIHNRYGGIPRSKGFSYGSPGDDACFKDRVLAYEKHVIEVSLRTHGGRVSDVIDDLKINRRTLNDKMQRLGIKRHGED